MENNVITILGKTIAQGERAEINFEVANLNTSSPISVPIIIERSKQPGPIILFTAGIHGDEVNGIEIVRQLIATGINKPLCGTIICMPIINIFGFINLKREFPDGRDLNRVFPGTIDGSLASRVAYKLITEIVPSVDYLIDFHTGGAGRFNAPQIRITKDKPEVLELAKTFAAPFTLFTTNLNKSFRNTCSKLGKPMLLFEGGKSFHIDENVTRIGVNGVKNILQHFNMLNPNITTVSPKAETVIINDSHWLRANFSGMFIPTVSYGVFVKKSEVLGNITDPYGKISNPVKAQHSGYILNVNEAPIVYQGDALFHISKKNKNAKV